MRVFEFNAASDYNYGGRALDFCVPLRGQADLSGVLVKTGITTDDIRVEVSTATVTGSPQSVSDHRVLRTPQTIGRNETGLFPISVPIDTTANDDGERTLLRVYLRSDSRIDFTKIRFLPELAYKTVAGKPAPLDNDGHPTLVFYPTTTAEIFPRTLSSQPYTPLVPSFTGTISVNWEVSLRDAVPADYRSAVTLTVKRPGERLAKQRVTVEAGRIDGPTSLTATIPVEPGQPLYFVADVETAETADAFERRVTIAAPEIDLVAAPSGTPVPVARHEVHLGVAMNEAFGGGFRQWSYGEWDGRECDKPIDELALRLPTGSETEEELKKFLDEMRFLQMIPFIESSGASDPGPDHWRVQDEECWIGPDRMSASRLGLNHLDLSDGSQFGGGAGVVKVGRSFNGGAKVSPPGLSLGASTPTTGRNDFRHLNGDRYPDVIGRGKGDQQLLSEWCAGEEQGERVCHRLTRSSAVMH
jgi:hypothetical protein